MEGYTAEIAQEIMEKFHQKGWNLYFTSNLKQRGSDKVIRQNLAEKLELNGKYVLLPAVDNPTDPHEVWGALEVLAVKLNHEMPTINVHQQYYPLTGITLNEHSVKIHTPEGTMIPYGIFIKALDSIVQTRVE